MSFCKSLDERHSIRPTYVFMYIAGINEPEQLRKLAGYVQHSNPRIDKSKKFKLEKRCKLDEM